MQANLNARWPESGPIVPYSERHKPGTSHVARFWYDNLDVMSGQLDKSGRQLRPTS